MTASLLDTPSVLRFDLSAFARMASGADHDVVARCVGPVLDIGCGPGRMTRALQRRRVDVLGLDVAPAAVRLARAAGAPVLRRNVFAHLPAERRWHTALLIDGNIGIGGDPVRLLRRCAELLAPCGRLIVEVDPQSDVHVRCQAVLVDTDGTRMCHPWAVLGSAATMRCAASAGFVATDTWTTGQRRFIVLAMPH